MLEDEITRFLRQFSLSQLEQIKTRIEIRAKEKLEESRKARLAADKARESHNRSVVGLPPTPPKDVAALAEAVDLDISGLMRDIDRRRR